LTSSDGLAVYERAFEPLWPSELVKSYFALVLASKSQKQFSDELRAKLAADPGDLRDAARLFYLYQQQGQLDSARTVLNSYREQKDARGAAWSADELATLARLLESVQDDPEAARYDFALASDHATPGSEQKGLVGLTRILLAAPEQPLRVAFVLVPFILLASVRNLALPPRPDSGVLVLISARVKKSGNDGRVVRGFLQRSWALIDLATLQSLR